MKTVKIIATYVLFWLIFYGSWLIMPKWWFQKNTEITGIFFLIYTFLIIPILSFFIPHYFSKKLDLSKKLLYSIHIIIIILSILLFLWLGLRIAFQHWQIG